jgi:hypothetical protein
MPKSKTRRKGATAGKRPGAVTVVDNKVPAKAGTGARPAPQRGAFQTLVMPAMVALGCWGLAISFAFFTTDPNRYLYAGMAAVMGLMWAFSFALQLRKKQLLGRGKE